MIYSYAGVFQNKGDYCMLKENIELLLEKLTLDEKIDMIHGCGLFETKGVERLGIPAFRYSDGPMGCRMDYHPTSWIPMGDSHDFTSYLPSNSALAATWNPDLALEAGRVLGAEARGRGKDMILAPGINIVRSPLCGRNFEYMSEDPCLISEIVVPLIKGIEENDVSSCVKHFALNNQETRRLDVDVTVSERALREIYLPGFKAAIEKGEAKGIMGAYNKLRGQHCCHNEYLLDTILRKEWNFKGISVSDWGGVHDTMEAAMNGLDVEMSVTDNFDDYYMANPLKELIKDGKVSVEKIDDKIRHILYVMNELHMLDGERKAGSYNNPVHREKILKVAQEAIVLLKNDDKVLPIPAGKTKKIAIIGDNANRIHSNGGGSAEIKALYEITPLLGMHMLLGGNSEIKYVPGYFANVQGNVWEEDGESWQASSLEDRIAYDTRKRDKNADPVRDARYREDALKIAKEADTVIFVGGLNHDYDVEGADKGNMKLPYEQDALIKELLKVRKDTIIVMIAGSPVDMSEWVDQASTLVYSSFIGMEGGFALAQVLCGQINPSGKLPITMPKCLEDSPAHKLGEFPGGDRVDYKEGIYVGYRYFDTFGCKPLFAFGYGLSYTDFMLTDLLVKTDANQIPAAKVMVKIENTGKVSGYETVQIYVHSESKTVERANKELKAFQKVFLQPGESQILEFDLNLEDFSYYSETEQCFVTEAGSYTILAGNSSNHCPLQAEFVLDKTYHLHK